VAPVQIPAFKPSPALKLALVPRDEPAALPNPRHAWLLLALLLLPFELYKVRDLPLPYFWDELGVYARAAVYLHDHTLGLLPAHLPPELSRGHPLLLPFLFGAIFRIFGATPVVAHIGMLVIGTGLAVSVYAIARRRWNATVGLSATALLLAQPLFLAQSTLLLPEVPLALACLWSIDTFSRKRYLAAGTWLALAIFLKETAVVLLPVLGTALLDDCRFSRPRSRFPWRGLLALAAPALLYGAFLLLQKRQNGWYLFPFHASQVDFHWPAIEAGLAAGLNFLFVEQGRLALSGAIAMAIMIRLFEPHIRSHQGLERFTQALVLFVCAMLVFSAGNVFMKRYLLCLLPPLALLGGRALYHLVCEQPKALFVATAVLCLVNLGELASPRFNCAYDMSFREAVLVQRQATQYLQDTVGAEKAVLANFPTVFGLEDSRYGYVPRSFERSSYRYSPEAEYVFASEIYDPYTPPEGVRMKLLKRFASPYMTIALYRILR
jgi:hypothetical protein